MKLTVGSLFAGIGGFDLGFERAGFEIKWQVEIDPFCRAVLAQHWPAVRRYEDVRAVRGTDVASVDVLCGGFPCQPHSLAGARGGAADERDLWPEFARLICEIRPRWVVAENVPGLLSSDAGRFFGTVLGDLAACGYDAEWDCVPACAVGAPHIRERIFVLAYPMRERHVEPSTADATAHHEKRNAQTHRTVRRTVAGSTEPGREVLSDADGAGLPERHEQRSPATQRSPVLSRRESLGVYATHAGRQWEVEPAVGRMADGVPYRVDRLRGIGNAIVPQIAEWIGHRIQEAEASLTAPGGGAR